MAHELSKQAELFAYATEHRRLAGPLLIVVGVLLLVAFFLRCARRLHTARTQHVKFE